jgi:hypothetical protein
MEISIKMVGRNVTRIGLYSLTHFTAIDFVCGSTEDTGINEPSMVFSAEN